MTVLLQNDSSDAIECNQDNEPEKLQDLQTSIASSSLSKLQITGMYLISLD